MNKCITCFFLVFMTVFSGYSSAKTDQLTNCLTGAIAEQDKKVLTNWVSFAIAAHPELAQLTIIGDDDRVAVNKQMADLVSRLLTKDCRRELARAQKRDSQAVGRAFELFGQLALSELVYSREVKMSLRGYLPHVDERAINRIITPNPQ
ncbi:hypothetical protein [Vibrio sp. WXL103]|uniref:hypothetical protein n=1 Tax=unclassified Vibrio TaxID=2614977 RepID=UPI003EC71D9F